MCLRPGSTCSGRLFFSRLQFIGKGLSCPPSRRQALPPRCTRPHPGTGFVSGRQPHLASFSSRFWHWSLFFPGSSSVSPDTEHVRHVEGPLVWGPRVGSPRGPATWGCSAGGAGSQTVCVLADSLDQVFFYCGPLPSARKVTQSGGACRLRSGVVPGRGLSHLDGVQPQQRRLRRVTVSGLCLASKYFFWKSDAGASGKATASLAWVLGRKATAVGRRPG